jgi:hypothetical protein
MLGQTLFACPAYQLYGEAIAQGRYEPPGFTVSLGLKDLNLILGTAAMSTMPMPLASLLHDRFLATIAKGWGHLDWAAIALGVAQDAGPSRQIEGGQSILGQSRSRADGPYSSHLPDHPNTTIPGLSKNDERFDTGHG